jgi:hypothetical protein
MKFHIKPAKPATSPKNYPDIDHQPDIAKGALMQRMLIKEF